MNATLVMIQIAVRHHQSDRHLTCLIRIVVIRRQSLGSEIFQTARESSGALMAQRLSLFRMAARACFRLERDPIFHAGARGGLDAQSVFLTQEIQ